MKLWHQIGMPVSRIGKDVTKSQFGGSEKEITDLAVFSV
jgi:hypothetical protein